MSEFGSGNASDVRINITSQGSQSTLDELVKIGAVDQKNADQFKANNAAHVSWLEKIQSEYGKEQAILDELYVKRSRAYTVDKIQAYNKEITDQTGRLKILQNQLNDTVSAVGQFEQKTKSAFTSFGQSFKQALFFGGVAGIGYQVGQWVLELADIRRYLEAFADLQQAEERLDFAVKNIAAEGQYMTDRLIKQANNLQKVTQFARKDLLEADTKLMTQFGLSGEQVETVMTRIADVAAGTGKSIDEITQRLGAGMEGRMVGLKQLGFNIKYAGDETKVLNDFMQDSQKFVGEAADKMDTLSGQIQHYNNLVETAKQETGEWLDGLLHESGELANFIGSMLNIPGQKAEFEAKALTDRLKKYAEENKDFIDSFVKNFQVQDEKSRKSIIAGNEDLINKMTANLKDAKDKLDAIDAEGIAGWFNLNGDSSSEHVEALKNYIAEEEKQLAIYTSIAEQIKDIDKGAQKPDKPKTTGTDYTKEIESIAEQREKQIQDLKDQTLANAESDEFQRRRDEAKKFYDDQLELIKKQKQKLQDILKKPSITPEQSLATAKQLQQSDEAEQAAGTEYQSSVSKINEDQFNKAVEAAQKISEEKEKAAKEKLAHAEKDEDDMTQLLKTSGETRLLQQKEQDAKALAELDKKYEKGLISEKNYQKQKKALEDQNAINEAKVSRDNLSNEQVPEKAKLADQLQGGQITQTEYDNAIQQMDNEMQAANDRITDLQTQLQLDLKNSWKETVQEVTDNIKEITDTLIEALITQSEAIQKSNDYKLSQQDKLIEEQEVLANRGLQNTLAFQIRQRDQLEQQQIAEQQKQKKLKELELFINSVANFAKNDPATAIPKALAVLAATKTAEAMFAEQGGVVGDIASRRILGGSVVDGLFLGRRHSQGGILLEAEAGEGILSRKEMGNLGLNNFQMLKNFLKAPLVEKSFSQLAGPSIHFDMSGVENRLDRVEKAIQNIPKINIDWDHYGEMIQTEIKDGIKKVTKHARALR